jgi:uncharacterized membrane protein YraQ (UPF0718 family)
LAEFLAAWAEATWQVLVDSAAYFLFGLILAGFVWLFLNDKILQLLLGRNRNQAVIRAALVGVPLPLCSCSVLPVASQLRRSGMSRGATVAFMIATPESSVDSILLTYSLTDPLLTVARPIAAFLTGALAGLTENVFDREPVSQMKSHSAEVDACGCDCRGEPPTPQPGLLRRIGSGIKYSFTVLIGDLAPYLFWGYLLAGLAAAILGPQFDFAAGSGWWSYIIALVAGVPLYVCATSSTPLAAVLLGAGFSPGAIMVFLLVGPATNMSTLNVARSIIGLRATVRYLISIIVVALSCGVLLDWLYGFLGVSVSYQPLSSHEHIGWFQRVLALILIGLIVWHTCRRLAKRLK